MEEVSKEVWKPAKKKAAELMESIRWENMKPAMALFLGSSTCSVKTDEKNVMRFEFRNPEKSVFPIGIMGVRLSQFADEKTLLGDFFQIMPEGNKKIVKDIKINCSQPTTRLCEGMAACVKGA